MTDHSHNRAARAAYRRLKRAALKGNVNATRTAQRALKAAVKAVDNAA